VLRLAQKLFDDGNQVGSLRVIASPGHTLPVTSPSSTLATIPWLLAIRTLLKEERSLQAFTVSGSLCPLGSRGIVLWPRSAPPNSPPSKPSRLAVGHVPTVLSPVAAVGRAVELAYQQHSLKREVVVSQ
jgi:hypothetical protein